LHHTFSLSHLPTFPLSNPNQINQLNQPNFTNRVIKKHSLRKNYRHLFTAQQKTYLCPMIKPTQHTLDKLEELYTQAGYSIRNEKGNFKSGSCVIVASKVIVLNKFSTVETKVAFLVESIQKIEMDETLLDEKNRKLLQELKQTEITF